MFYGLISVGAGAALGAWLRWGLSLVLNPIVPMLPLGTLSANLVGGYLIGLVLGYIDHFQALSPEARLFVTTGFLGGLTTFSTFSGEVSSLLLRGEYVWAGAVIAANLFGSIVLTLFGVGTIAFAKSWLSGGG
ncbi:MAG TPA: fluoride efflux transporter CrcB [Pseudomonadales bacterium]|nr:fluoride efflux transporter CrcB [Pseudomonadales bacterium]